MLPTITITDAAATVLRKALDEASEGDVVHLEVSARFDHSLEIGPTGDDGIVQDVADVPVCIDAASLGRANGISIDYVEAASGGGFRIDNPNAPPSIIEVDAPALKALLDAKEIEKLVDVRTPWERETASLAGSALLDQELHQELVRLPKDTPIAFYCHHGVRSRSAASQFTLQGFTKIYNLTGGIDAWSDLVDSKIPRY